MHLHVVFDCFQEHNLKLKPAKCEFFQDEINYLAHHISREGVMAQQRELKSCGQVCSTPNIHRNLNLSGLDGALLVIHQRVCTYHAQPLQEHLSWEGTSKKCRVSNAH